MNADDPASAIRSAIRDRLQQLAGEFGDLAELSRIQDDDAGGVVWRLQPTYPDAAPVTWDESRTDEWAAYLTLGRATEVRVLTCPTGPLTWPPTPSRRTSPR